MHFQYVVLIHDVQAPGKGNNMSASYRVGDVTSGVSHSHMHAIYEKGTWLVLESKRGDKRLTRHRERARLRGRERRDEGIPARRGEALQSAEGRGRGMNTNHEDTGVTVSLRKTGHIVHLDVSTVAGTVGIELDDTKSVYTAMHEAKDDIARLVSQSIDKTMVWMSDANDEVQLFTPTDAAAVLDGKQVATPVNVDDSYAGRITHGGFLRSPMTVVRR
jgi:hypothetical protein